MIAPSLERLSGWGMTSSSTALSYRPRDAAEVAEAVSDATARGLTIGHRGAGISYGDAALNAGGAVIHLDRLVRILEFDADRGVVRAEAGVTIGQLWKVVLGRGWWPPVVPGTMHVTLGGSVAMNIHGKNAYKVGPFGDHVVALTLLDSRGDVVELHRERDCARLREVIGAQGLNGTILDVTLQLKRVHAGVLDVTPIPTRSLSENLEQIDGLAREQDYAVGWIDAFATGRALGRGLLHGAKSIPPDHPAATSAPDVAAQALPPRVMGVVPSRFVWRLAKPLVHSTGMRTINFAKYVAGHAGGTRSFLQPHAAFHFLLDYVPNWKYVYRPGGLVQYQFFAPKEHAYEVLQSAIRLQQRAGLVSYLAVLKRHRRDEYAASYSVDGYSLALDFPMRGGSAERLQRMFREFDALQRESGGHVYAAKDSSSIGELPQSRDPQYSSDLVRRWERQR